jgi:hypothetical protein
MPEGSEKGVTGIDLAQLAKLTLRRGTTSALKRAYPAALRRKRR